MVSVNSILSGVHDVKNVSQLCRFCGKLKQPAISIFDKSHLINYQEIINFHFKGIQVSKTDDLPLKVCSDCMKIVLSWHSFHNTCLRVNNALLSVVNKLNVKVVDLESECDSTESKNDVEVVEVGVECLTPNIRRSEDQKTNENVIEKLRESNIQTLIVDEIRSAEDAESNFLCSKDIVSKTLPTKITTHVVEYTNFPPSQNLLSNQCTLGGADEFLVDVAELSDSSKSKPETVNKVHDEVVLFSQVQDFPLLKGFILNDTTSQHHCSTCFKAHATKEELIQHIRVEHESSIGRSEMYECDMCVEVFVQNTHRNYHRLSAHNIRTPLDAEFKVARTNYQQTKSTIELDGNDNLLSCEYCEISFGLRSKLKLHKMRKHGVIYQNVRRCNICSMVLLNKRALKHHIKTVHSKLLDEDARTKITISEEYLQFLSKRIVYDGELRYFQCEECQYKCRGLHQFMRHGKRHINSNPTCAYCEKSFSQKSLLRRHISTVHLDVRNFQCTVCGRPFGEKKHMQQHMNLHKDECSYICEVCGKQFKQAQSLDSHKQVHRGEKSFACEYCDKTFTFRNRLFNHMRQHTGKNLSVCQLCEKKFTCSAQLKKHMYSHSDVKAFQCSVCGKRLKTKQSLRQHMVLCHGNIKQNRQNA